MSNISSSLKKLFATRHIRQRAGVVLFLVLALLGVMSIGVARAGNAATYVNDSSPDIYYVDSDSGFTQVYYRENGLVSITIHFVNTVTVTGEPSITLNNGGTAFYESGTGTMNLKFIYKVATNENTNDLNYIDTAALKLPNGATIKDGGGNIDTTLPGVTSSDSLAGKTNICIDTKAPTITSIKRSIPTSEVTSADELTFEVTFSEDVTSINKTDFIVHPNNSGKPNTSAIPSGVYALTWDSVVPVKVSDDPPGSNLVDNLVGFNGLVGLDINATRDITDKAGNLLEINTLNAANDETYTVDNIRPNVTIQQTDAADPTKTSPIYFTITFDEKVSNFDSTYVTLNSTAPGAKLDTNVAHPHPSDSVDPHDVYTVSVSGMTDQGNITINVPENKVTDLAGNKNNILTSDSDNSVYYDVAPKIESIKPNIPIEMIDGVYTTTQNLLSFTVKFSEAVTGFNDNVNDVKLIPTKGTATVTKIEQTGPNDGTTYQVDVTLSEDCRLTFSIPNGAAKDADDSEQDSEASAGVPVEYDGTAPIVSIARADGQTGPTNQYPIVFEVTFNEKVWGFDKADIDLSNSTANLTLPINDWDIKTTTANKVYEVSVYVSDKTSEGDVYAFIKANAVRDSSKQDRGNPNSASNPPVVVHYDGKAPAAPVITPFDSPTKNNTPTITGTTALDTHTINITIDGISDPAQSVIIAADKVNWSWSYNTVSAISAKLSDGEHTIAFTAADALGNTSVSNVSSSITFTVDTKSDTPTISSPLDGSYTNTTPAITGTAEAGGTVTLDINATSYGPITVLANNGTWTYTPTLTNTVSTGTSYTVIATSKDALQNPTSGQSKISFVLDTIAPNIPKISSPSAKSYINVTRSPSPVVTISNIVSDYTDYATLGFTIINNSTQVVSSVTDTLVTSSWSHSLPNSLVDGEYTLYVTVTDKAKNPTDSAHVIFNVDNTAPKNTKIDTKPNKISDNANFTFSANDTNLSGFECLIDTKTDYQDCDTALALSNLPNGSHTLQKVRAKDKAGNVDSIPAGPYSWDLKKPPSVDEWGVPTNPSFTNYPTFTFSNTDSTITFMCALDSPVYEIPCTSSKRYPFQDNGPHTFMIRAVDAKKNVGPEKTYDWVINDTAIKSHPASVTTATRATFTFDTAYKDPDLNTTTTFKCALNGIVAWTDCSSKSWSSPLLKPGKYVFQVIATQKKLQADGKSFATISDSTAAPYSWTVIPAERSINRSFNLYTGTSKTPTSWVSSLFTALDGKDTSVKQEGLASVKLVGDGKVKTLTQTLNLTGLSGTPLTFSFYAKGSTLPIAGVCTAQVTLYRAVGLPFTKSIDCANGTYAFTKKGFSFVAPWAFNKIVIKFTFSKPSGMIWLDMVSLTW